MDRGGEPRVAVVGGGAWGTTLAAIVAQREPVTLLCHSPETARRIVETGRNEDRVPGVDLPANLRATADPASLATAADLVIFAVPSAHLRDVVTMSCAARVPRRRTCCRSSRGSSGGRISG